MENDKKRRKRSVLKKGWFFMYCVYFYFFECTKKLPYHHPRPLLRLLLLPHCRFVSAVAYSSLFSKEDVRKADDVSDFSA
jgi:hypothetical protein